MKTRCTNPRASNYAFYGGRGIGFCDRWKSFTAFVADMGECPDGKTLDRIDGSKDYAPDNCQWASAKEQANNRRSSRVLCLRGERLTMAQAADLYGVLIGTIFARLKRGWSDEQAVGLAPRAAVFWNRHAGRLEARS